MRSSCSTSCSAPFGPLPLSISPSTFAVTPVGTITAFLPIRDMAVSSISGSEHRAEHFAANVGVACVVIGHHALGGRKDRDTQAVIDARQIAHRDIDTAAGLGDSRHFTDHRLAV